MRKRYVGAAAGLCAVLLALGLVYMTAFSSTDAASRHGAPRRAHPTTTTTTPPPTYPLTGLPATDPATLDRPALTVKIDNAPDARPQSGLDKADVVYEEVVEGGITRYLAVFQSQDADPLGPVRSVRATDADVVRPIGGLFAYSGGIPNFVSLVRATGVTDVGADTDPLAYYRSSGRAAPHNLYSSTATLRRQTPAGAAPPPPLFSYRSTSQPFGASGSVASGALTVVMSPETVAKWQWNPIFGVWTRSTNGTPQASADGSALAFANVVVEIVPYHDTGFVDPSGAPVPDADVVGSGPGLVLSGGKIAHCTWTKPTPQAVTALSDSSGAAVALSPGTTFVELAPQTALTVAS